MIDFKIVGDRQLRKKFMKLPGKTTDTIAKKSIGAGAMHILKLARKNQDRKQSGALRKSLIKKVTLNKHTKEIVGVIGPKSKFVVEYEGKRRKPSLYAHLTHSGFTDPAGVFHPGNQFLKRAGKEGEAFFFDVMQKKMAKEIEKSWSKLK